MDNYYFLKGEKVQLRPYQEEDLSLLNKWFNDAEVTYFMFTGQRPTTLEQTKKQFEEEINSDKNTIFIITDIQNSQPIGLVGLYDIHETALSAEMRILIGNKDFWGKGFGTEITELITYYGFDRLNLHRIYLGVTSENKGGAKAYERAGYVHEGVLREDIYRNSRYYDSVRMAILRDDYYDRLHDNHQKKFSISK